MGFLLGGEDEEKLSTPVEMSRLQFRVNQLEAEVLLLKKEYRDLEASAATLKTQRDAWKSDAEMFARAWRRELGGKTFHKTHLIDALVMTTRYHMRHAEQWRALRNAARPKRKLMLMVGTAVSTARDRSSEINIEKIVDEILEPNDAD